MKLFFDTETTGKCDFKASFESERQPHLVQLGALLTEDSGEERAVLNCIIQPFGWTVPAEAASVHGITTEIADRSGVPLASALSLFSMLCAKADTLVAHNIDFDLLISKCAYHRLGRPSRIEGMKLRCTMKESTDICKIRGPHGFKWPKLTEAFQHLTGKPMEGAHDALADVRGCAAVFFAMEALKK